jgi:hypothetical protein
MTGPDQQRKKKYTGRRADYGEKKKGGPTKTLGADPNLDARVLV